MRRSTFQSLLASALAFALSAPSLASESAPSVAAVAPKDLLLVIRADDDDATHGAAARLLAAAEAGNSFAMYDIGSLHRQSRRKNAAAFAYDPGKALRWLTRAFDGGRLTAAYKISLTHAALGDDMEAMAWAQVYSHYMHAAEQKRGQPQQLRLALLNDLYSRVGRDREEAIRKRTIALLEQHGPRFEDRSKHADPLHPEWIRDAATCQVKELPKGLRPAVRVPASGMVEYLVEIESDGSPGEFVSLDAAPHPMHARDLRQLVSRVECQPATTAPRYVFQNFTLQFGPRLRLIED